MSPRISASPARGGRDVTAMHSGRLLDHILIGGGTVQNNELHVWVRGRAWVGDGYAGGLD